MKKKFQIVAPGNWNPSVFNPGWIGKYLDEFLEPGKRNQIDLGVDLTNIAFSLSFSGLTLAPTDNVLTIGVEEEANVESAIKLFVKIANLLPHTTLKGVGVNFIVEDYEGDKFASIIKSVKDNGVSLSELQWREEFEKYVIVRILKISNSVTYIKNYHFNSAIELLDTPIAVFNGDEL